MQLTSSHLGGLLMDAKETEETRKKKRSKGKTTAINYLADKNEMNDLRSPTGVTKKRELWKTKRKSWEGGLEWREQKAAKKQKTLAGGVSLWSFCEKSLFSPRK